MATPAASGAGRATRFLSVLLVAALAACGSQDGDSVESVAASTIDEAQVDGVLVVAAGDNPAACVEDFDPEIDYFPQKVEPVHARQFRVEYHRHYKVVTLSQPWQDAAGALTYLLVQCGTPRPGGFEGVDTIEIPARTVITTSTTELPHIVRLGLVDRLVGHDEFDWVNSPEIRRRIDSGEMIEVGSVPALNVELVVAAEADLLLVDSFGDSGGETLAKLREVGVPVALLPSFLETSPLGRAEWILYTSLFFNRERQARSAFAEVAENYRQLAATVATATERPTVLSGATLGGVWHVPGGDSFSARLLADAGARYLWADERSTGSLPLNLESVYERALEADYWLHPGTLTSLDELRAFEPRFAAIPAFRSGRVFNNHARLNEHGGNDFWETGSARPDLVLADLIEIFHPGLLDHELVFHRRLVEASGRD